jgi:predicted site-specific integrase-resolvase
MLKSDLLNIADLVKEIGVSRSTINRWIKDGKLKPIKIGSVKLYSVKVAHRLNDKNK